MPLKLEDYVTTDQSVHNFGNAIRKMKTGAWEEKIVSEYTRILEALRELKSSQDSMKNSLEKILGYLGNLHYKEFNELEIKSNDLLTGINKSLDIIKKIEENSFNDGYKDGQRLLRDIAEKVKTPTTLSESLAGLAKNALRDYKRKIAPMPWPLVSETTHDVRKEARYFEKRVKELKKVEEDIEKLFERSNSHMLIWRFTTRLSEMRILKFFKTWRIESIANKGEKLVGKIISDEDSLLLNLGYNQEIPISLDEVLSRVETLGGLYCVSEKIGLASNKAARQAVDLYNTFVELLRKDETHTPKEIKVAYRK